MRSAVISEERDSSMPVEVQCARPSQAYVSSTTRLLVSPALCIVIVLIAVITAPACIHWFLIPLFACGAISCFDGLLLFADRGQNLFKPVPLVGAFGFYFFFIAPLLHVACDYWFTSETWAPADIPEDWRTWLGLMASLNLIGIGLYKLTYKHFARAFRGQRFVVYPRINARHLKFYGLIFCTVVFLLQVYVYYRFGGIGGFVQTFDDSSKGRSSDFHGLGWLFALAESFPALFTVTCTALFKLHLKRVGTLRFLVYMCGAFLLALFFGGLRGSRGNTIYTLAYIVGVFHFTVKPISRKTLVALALAFALFMYVYGFYKSNPEIFADPGAVMDTMLSHESRALLENTSHRSLETVFMGDLDRADLQAYLLFQLVGQRSEAELGYGRTYFEGALSFIPSGLFPVHPPGKLKFGTDAVYGVGTYSPARVSSKIYGAAGEAMLNFGGYGAPLGFLLVALSVGYAEALSARVWSALDARRYFIPIASLVCIVCVSNDFDNVLFFLLQHALMPFLLIKVCTGTRAPTALAKSDPFLLV